MSGKTALQQLLHKMEQSTVLSLRGRWARRYIESQSKRGDAGWEVRARDVVTLREAAEEVHALRLRYTGQKLSKKELLRRTAGHVGLSLPKSAEERIADHQAAAVAAASKKEEDLQ